MTQTPIENHALDLWMAVYEASLRDIRDAHPDEYPWPKTELPAIVLRMRAAFGRGSYNKDGRAIKLTCKTLDIPYTYQAINAFLKGDA